jgi:hypothetical protein
MTKSKVDAAEVLRLIGLGLSNAEVIKETGISEAALRKVLRISHDDVQRGATASISTLLGILWESARGGEVMAVRTLLDRLDSRRGRQRKRGRPKGS